MKMPWRRKKKPSAEVLEIERSLQQTKILIAQAYAGFNSAADPELVESYVYEIQALQARYSYLLRQRKAYDSPTAEKRTAPRRATVRPAPAKPLATEPAAPERLRTAEGPAHPVLPVA